MPRQVAILHGWSDNSESFRPLAKYLKDKGYKTIPIFLGDYISLRDDVNIDDVAKRMEEVVLEKMARPKTARTTSVRNSILSSTALADLWRDAGLRQTTPTALVP